MTLEDTTTEAGVLPVAIEGMSGPEAFGPQRFQNRELSRLSFGGRILDRAEDSSVPLLERVKFSCDGP